ncbi:hypothetical protein COO60DRAFT_761544 [Scenedesmus sp. NREL 46B-D3]|nr:hypothetical protein COO60DRAFT_761544 [Scenedesmus sp. NREL 46B-D3]
MGPGLVSTQQQPAAPGAVTSACFPVHVNEQPDTPTILSPTKNARQKFDEHRGLQQPQKQQQVSIATSHQDTMSQVLQQQQQEQHSSTQQQQEALSQQQQELQQQHQAGDELLVSVPLHLVLSCNIPGCSPTPADTPPALRTLLHSSSSSSHWEMQLAELLLWAVRQPQDSQLGGFWRRYTAELIPSLNEQAGLLLWSKRELEQLQDRQLRATALAWQAEVHQAYYSAVQPAFDSMASARGDHQESGNSSSSSSRGPTLEEWLWAVAAVESRAFGVLRTQVGSSGQVNLQGRLQQRPASAYLSNVLDCSLCTCCNRVSFEPLLAPGKCTAAYSSHAGPGDLRPSSPGAPSGLLCRHASGSKASTSKHACSAEKGCPPTAHLQTSHSRGSSSDNGSHSSAAAAASQSAVQQQPAPASQIVGMVPVLDLANHTCRSDCHHAIDYNAGRFNLYTSNGGGSRTASRGSSSSSSSSGSASQQSDIGGIAVDQAGQQEVLITYGEKDNRHLMEQYGFIVSGNPYDRVHFNQQGQQQQGQQQQQQQQQQLWMSHTAVKQAAQRVKEQLVHRQEQAATAFAAAADVLDFKAAHVDGAVASIVSTAGWTNLRQYKQVTAGSTRARAQQLLVDVQGQLAGFPTTAAEDQLMLKRFSRRRHKGGLAWKVRQGGSAASSSSSSNTAAADSRGVSDVRMSTAVQYRLERKLLLEATMHVLQAVQADLG